VRQRRNCLSERFSESRVRRVPVPGILSGIPTDLSCKLPIPVGTAGPQLQAPDHSEHQLQGTKRQIECQNICQRKCQIECETICQIECQDMCHRECQIQWLIGLSERMSGYMLDRLSDCMPDRMSEYYVRQRGKNSRERDVWNNSEKF
jgi:hypothetical protein